MLFSFPNQRRTWLHATRGAFFSLVLLILFAACGGDGEDASPQISINGKFTTPITTEARIATPNDLLQPGVLTVGSYTSYVPQEFVNPATGKITGFDIDLITAIAGRMGLKVNIVMSGFSSLLDNLLTKDFDVAISAVTINTDRQRKVDFIPYFSAGKSLLVQKGNPSNVTSIEDLCGMDVGVRTATVEETDLKVANDTCQQSGKEAINVIARDQQADVIQLLTNKQVVATYQDSPVTDYYLSQSSGRFEIGGSVTNVAPEGIAVRKDDASMMQSIQSTFNALKANGTYTSLLQKWGLARGAITLARRHDQIEPIV